MNILESEIRERERESDYDDENKYEGFVLFLEQNKNMKRVMFGSVHWLDFIDKLMSAQQEQTTIELSDPTLIPSHFLYTHVFRLVSWFFYWIGICSGGPQKRKN